jgi:hypothetical protein
MDFLNLCLRAQEELDLDPDVRLEKGEFCAYDTIEEIILLNWEDALSQGEEFYSFAEELFTDARQFSLSFLSLLHEFGHHYDTMDYNEALEYLLRISVTNPEDYYRIPSEYAATEWAVNFIAQNREKCEKLNKLFKEFEGGKVCQANF